MQKGLQLSSPLSVRSEQQSSVSVHEEDNVAGSCEIGNAWDAFLGGLENSCPASSVVNKDTPRVSET